MKRQMDERKLDRDRNRGFTLVELIITLAIMTIVVLSATQLIVYGVRIFTRTNTNADVQTEAQLLESQLNSLIIDAQTGIYAQSGMDEEGNLIDDEGNIVDADTTGGITAEVGGFSSNGFVQVFNEDVAYYIAWDQPSQKVYYKDVTVSYDENGAIDEDAMELEGDAADITAWDLMAEGVVNFVPDASRVTTENRLVQVALTVSKGTAQYDTVQSIYLRNDVLNTNNLGDLYGSDEDETELPIRSVKVYAGSSSTSANVVKGGTLTLTAEVYTAKGLASSQDVIWSVTGVSTNPQTTTLSNEGQVVNGGSGTLLSVGQDETSARFTVTATANGTSVSGSFTIIVPQVSAITISVSNSSPKVGSQVYCTAVVDGYNLSDSARAVTWSCSGNATISSDGTLQINSNANVGDVVTITATTTDGTSASRDLTIAPGEVTGLEIVNLSGGSGTLNRNGTLQLTATVDGVPYSDVDWSITNDAGLGSKVGINSSGLVSATQDINYGKSYNLTIQAKAKNSNSTATFTVTIPVVSISFSSNIAYVVRGGSVRFPYTITGLENPGSQISVTSNPSLSGLSGTYMYCSETELVVYIGSSVTKSQAVITASLEQDSAVSGTVTVVIEKKANVSGTGLYLPDPEDVSSPCASMSKGDTLIVTYASDWVQYEYTTGGEYIVYVNSTGKSYTWNSISETWVVNS